MTKPDNATPVAGGSPVDVRVRRLGPDGANFAFLSGEADPMKASEPGRRFWVECTMDPRAAAARTESRDGGRAAAGCA